MAERNDESPSKASYAFWTLQNVWKNFSYKTNGLIGWNGLTEDNKVQNVKSKESSLEASNRIAQGNERLIAPDTEIEENEEEIRKNVWIDVDDELYIANLLKKRTTNEVKREKRDISDSVSEVVSSVKLDNEMWELEPTDLTECDCLGPPPEFLLPPPPRPPFLQTEYYCGDEPIPDLETCDTEPVSFISSDKDISVFSISIAKQPLTRNQS